ncbi:c-type cytochrome [Fodinicola acaciae]|uniref:cytochrome bc1 complex diheme cytochrome c subunit n=1 Tax=Fodinicola acaciae TaxID=2681555 RepID=UPI0013D765FD|nr:c-type cytochrome [Fodinicola acaciae]
MISSFAGRAYRRTADLAKRRSGALLLVAALAVIGASYAAFTPSSSAAPGDQPSVAVREGQRLFNESCISCHGRNLQGVPGRGPSLIGVGGAAVDFQVSSGRMPLAAQAAQAARKPAKFNDAQIAQLAAYVQANGGGPDVPSGQLRSDDKSVIAEGGQLFRLNCAACHAMSTKGGALSSGKTAPNLVDATDRQIYEAMLTGPENMPVFGNNQLTPDQKKAIVSYVQAQKADMDQGGFGIGRSGPVPEGLVVFVVGIVALLFVGLWIAGKS